jgi:hypothetical protein
MDSFDWFEGVDSRLAPGMVMKLELNVWDGAAAAPAPAAQI